MGGLILTIRIGGGNQMTVTSQGISCLLVLLASGFKNLYKKASLNPCSEFDASIEYYWAPFIVESISDHATKHTVLKRLVKLDSIANHGKHCEGVDILVFESCVWWMHSPTINATYESPDVQEYNVTTAYKLALTLGRLIRIKYQPRKAKGLLHEYVSNTLWSWEWKPGSDENCFNESYPNQGSYWVTGSDVEIMDIIQDQMQDLKVKVTFFNINQSSEYRKDAQASVYGERRGKLLTNKQRSDPENFSDCIHRCLPGVPDTWNEILYARLSKSNQNLL